MAEDIEKINETTYKVEWSDDASLIFGGGEVDLFTPTIDFSRFNGLVNFRIECPADSNTVVDIPGTIGLEKVEYKTNDYDINFYPVETDSIEKEDGGFELEIVLKVKPVSNQLILNYTSENLIFEKQLAYDETSLSPEDIAAGVVEQTPTEGKNIGGDVIARVFENMINSYNIYYTDAKMIYHDSNEAEKIKSGKAFCIPRLKATDADLTEVWLDQDFDGEGNYTITIPQDFLDTAVYPVVIDPTFGYTTLPTAGSFSLEDNINGHLGTPAEAGTVDSYHIALSGWGGGEEVKMALYTAPGDALVSNSTSNARSDGGTGWQTFTLPATCNITSQLYIIVGWTGSTMSLLRDSGSGNQARFETGVTYTGTFPSSINGTYSTFNYGTYCTYTATTYKMEGVTKDIDGNTLGNCDCHLFKLDGPETDATWVAFDESDGSGNYSFTGLTDNDAKYFVIAWKDNTPHVFDCTDHVLVPVAE